MSVPFAAAQDGVAGQSTHHDQSRPKIGLALSGGGARGAAHIGVLKVLEENRIPVDYIAGTSMGSIVGALYATGMSPDDIGDVIDSIDWAGVFSDPTPREERSFRRKRDDEFYLVKARPGIGRQGLKFPAGVVQGQKIDLVLKRFIVEVGDAANFDDFQIPFRAVATDLVTGEEVVLSAGSLAQAVRASMSVPAAFAPTVIDDRMLVDGGMANNMPISVVRDMGADVVIAVDISTPLLTREDVASVLAVTVQLTGFLTQRNTQAQLASLTADDVLITPDLGDITSSDFERAAEAIPTGRTAAMEALGQLQRLSISPASYAAHEAQKAAASREPRQVDFIRIDNQSRIKDSIIAHRVHDTRVSEPLSIDALERDIGRIYGLELFQNVSYDIVEQDDQTGVLFSVRERAWGPTYLQLGAAYDSNSDGDSIFNVGFSTLSTGLNQSNGELRLGLQLGEEPAVLADYHQPFGSTGMWFANLRGSYGARVATVFESSLATANLSLTEGLVESSVGREFGTWGEARIGLRYADGEAKVRIGDRDTIPNIDFTRGETFATLYVDELDSYFFPTKGSLARLNWMASRRDLGANTNYEQLGFNSAFVKSWGANTFIGTLDYQSTISGRAPIEGFIRAGGLFNMSGFNRGELIGQHYARASAVYYRRIHKIDLLPMYIGVTLEKGNVFENRSDIRFGDMLDAGSVFVGVESFIGPLYAAYGAAQGSNEAFYVFLGRAF